ncbi:MAG: PIN domain-containing protein [Candidatus Sulfotelmatobacter sp.]
MSEVARFLRRHRSIAVDTSCFIYQIQEHPMYVALTDAVFRWIEEPRHQAFTSTITMTELLVHGYREDDRQKIDSFYGLLSLYPNLHWIPLHLETADAVARIRAKYKLRTPDAIQAATALRLGATGFVTNDPVFGRVEGIETAVLDHFL